MRSTRPIEPCSFPATVRAILPAIVGVLVSATTGPTYGEEPMAPIGVIRTIDGGSLSGRFVPSDEAGVIRWQGEPFVGPFEFPRSSVASVAFPPDPRPRRPEGEFAIELGGGELLSGKIVEWNAETVVLETAEYGTLHLRTSAVRRFFRLQDNPTLLFPGLAGLDDSWHVVQGDWTSAGTWIGADKPGALLGGTIPLPEQVSVEIELSWGLKSNFVFALGVDPKARKDRRQDGYRFEVWGSTLAVVRENADSADVAPVVKLEPDPGRIHLVCHLDQTKGEMHVHDPAGFLLAKVAVSPKDPFRIEPENQGIRCVVRQGEFRIHQLRVMRWDGILPGELEPGMMRLRPATGSPITGRLLGLDRESSEWRIEADGEERRLPIGDVVLAESRTASEPIPEGISAVLQDGTRIQGNVESILGDAITLRTPAVEEPLSIPFVRLRALTMAQGSAEPKSEKGDGRGLLRIGDQILPGKLLPAQVSESASCFVWQPTGSRVGSALLPGRSAEIVYREPNREAVLPTEPNRVINRQAGGNFFNLLLAEQAKPSKRPIVTPASESSLYLRSGDVIPCRVVEIAEEGVRIESSVAEKTLIAHSLIKALQLVKSDAAPDLKEAKKQRLLTVPRLMKSSPPTHLLISKTGDFLRCRVLALQNGELTVELQLEEIRIPVDRVGEVIWFHPEETESSGGAASASLPPPAGPNDPPVDPAGEKSFSGMAQVVKPNGDRVTFSPVSFGEGTLQGVSEVLGNVRFNITHIDRVLIGGRIALAAASLPYQQWVLTPAKEPLVSQQGADGAPADTGKISPLVGQPAPDFQLELLDGKPFKLSGQHGKIVVLDFWASWCGPCMKTMPLVEEAMRDFDPEKVRLVSVNLEEPKPRIQAALDRQGLQLTVAMDIDGTTARKYQANAIPQMVVIDRTGKVARLYVGGGAEIVEQLRQALRDLLDAAP